MKQLPDFAYFVTTLPDQELQDICVWLSKNEKDYLTMMGELTKFRPIFVKTKAKPAQQLAWFRRFSAAKPEFAPIWLLAYGSKVLMPIEEAAVAKLPIGLREELGYEPTDAENPPTPAQIVSFLKEAEAAYGLVLTRQFGNMLLLLMEPDFKDPVAEALDELEWTLCVPPAPEGAIEEATPDAPAPKPKNKAAQKTAKKTE